MSETSSSVSTTSWSIRDTGISNETIACMARTKQRFSYFQNATINILTDQDARCPSIRNGTMVWPQTKAGDTVKQPCPGNTTGNCSRRCQRDGAWSVIDCDDCVNQKLASIVNEIEKLGEGLDVSNNTLVASTVGLLSDFTNAATGPSLSRGDLSKSIEAMDLLTKIRNTTEQTPNKEEIQSAVKVINNLLATNKSSSNSPKEGNGAAAAATLMSFGEVYGQALSRSINKTGSTTVKVETPLVVLEAISSDAKGLPKNFSFPLPEASDQKESRSDRISLTLNDTDLADNRTGDSLNAWSLSYQNIDAFLQNTGDYRINSRVLSLSLSAIPPGRNLSNPVEIVLQHSTTPEANESRMCVFWKFGENGRGGNWSDEGCQVVPGQSNANQTVCSCHHLTNFAILMSSKHSTDDPVLSVVSTVGCCASIAALVLTIVFYAVTWKQSKSHQAAVLLNFCVALVFANVVFLLGADRARLGLSEDLCTAVAVLLHYFYLAAFFIMLAEGIQLFIYVAFVFHAKRIKETALLIVTAWVLPMIIVAITFGSTNAGGYRSENICWLPPNAGRNWAFGGPAFFIIGVNCLIMVIVIARISFNKLSSKKTNRKQKIRGMLWNLAALCPVLGSTWLIGILSINSTHPVYQYIFAIVNSLQGVFVFVFHVLFPNQKFNERLYSLFPCRRCAEGRRTGPKASGMPTASTAVVKSTLPRGLEKELETEVRDIAKKLTFDAKAAVEDRGLDVNDDAADDDVTSETEASEAGDVAKKLAFRAKVEFFGLDLKDAADDVTSETDAKSGYLSSKAMTTDDVTQSPKVLACNVRLDTSVAAMISAYEAKSTVEYSNPGKKSVTFKIKDLVLEERSVADDLELLAKTVINDVIANAKTQFDGFSPEEKAKDLVLEEKTATMDLVLEE